MRPTACRSLALLALVAAAVPAAAQRSSDDSDASWLANCRNGWNGNDDRGRACEVRVIPVRLSGRAIEVDGRENGSIRVEGWDGDSVRVSARLQGNARSDEDAQKLLADVRVTADGRTVSASGPSTREWDRTSWSVSYLVLVPRRFDLSLEAHNGSLRVTGVQGRMELRTQNGSVGLAEVGGDVRARTQNGSLNVHLTGTRWDGTGLDAETQNGSVRLNVPERYAAQLETGTVNGRINTEIPLTIRGTISRRLSIPLNGGGPTVRALTTNGSVTISNR
jgi:hypothetical protein